MKKFATVVLTGAMAISLAACGANGEVEQSTNVASTTQVTQTTDDTDESEGAVQIATPFRECSSMNEAERLVGFRLQTPTKVNDQENTGILVYEDTKMIQLDFGDGALSVRKEAQGTNDKEDISGVYEEYSEKSQQTLDDISVSLAGKEHMVYVATWEANGYNYSVSADKGMAYADMTSLITEIK